MKGTNTGYLNHFISGLLDIQMARNPLSEEVIVVFNDTVTNQYGDTQISEAARVKKLALVKKDTSLDYVQQLGDTLLEDADNLPWTISLTITNLPRIPKQDDKVLIDGFLYNISAVRPINRDMESTILLFVHPERTIEDQLNIYAITRAHGGYLDILYGGHPVSYSDSAGAIDNPASRQPFKSIIPFPTMDPTAEYQEGDLWFFDDKNEYVTYHYRV